MPKNKQQNFSFITYTNSVIFCQDWHPIIPEEVKRPRELGGYQHYPAPPSDIQNDWEQLYAVDGHAKLLTLFSFGLDILLQTAPFVHKTKPV